MQGALSRNRPIPQSSITSCRFSRRIRAAAAAAAAADSTRLQPPPPSKPHESTHRCAPRSELRRAASPQGRTRPAAVVPLLASVDAGAAAAAEAATLPEAVEQPAGRGGGAVAPGVQAPAASTVALPMGEATVGGATLPTYEAARRPRAQTASPTAAMVGGAAGALTSSAGASAVPRPPSAEAELFFAPTVHLTSGIMGGGS